MENSTEASQKIKNRIPYDPEIPLLGIYLKEMKTYILSLLVAALFTMAKTRTQPRRPSVDGWIKKMQYISTVEYYPTITKKETLPFEATRMDLRALC